MRKSASGAGIVNDVERVDQVVLTLLLMAGQTTSILPRCVTILCHPDSTTTATTSPYIANRNHLVPVIVDLVPLA